MSHNIIFAPINWGATVHLAASHAPLPARPATVRRAPVSVVAGNACKAPNPAPDVKTGFTAFPRALLSTWIVWPSLFVLV